MEKYINFIDQFIPDKLKQNQDLLRKTRFFLFILCFSLTNALITKVLLTLLGIEVDYNLYITISYHVIVYIILWLLKNISVSINIFVLFLVLQLNVIIIEQGGLYSPVVYWLCLIPMLLLFILDKIALVWSFLVMVNLVVLFQISDQIPPTPNKHYLLLNIFLMVLFTGIITYVFSESQKKLLKKVKNQKNILKDKEIAELKLQALQSQMNPHFIFNALQAIQDFTTGKDERAVNKYMTSFSKLMRLFLESSQEKYISLEEELTLIRLYLELEQLRFDPPFEFKIVCPESIDWGAIEIPSMLLQPFVENAINHGLKYKTTRGFVHLNISEQENLLSIQIIDNGVGIKKAKAIKQNATNSYKSRAMEITKERVKNIQYLDEIEINIEVKDRLIDGQVKGTIVNILCPFIDRF